MENKKQIVAECRICGKVHPVEDMMYDVADNDYVCEDCFAEYDLVICSDCGSIIDETVEVNGYHVCHRCAEDEDKYYRCYDCGKYCIKEDSSTYDEYCKSCAR